MDIERICGSTDDALELRLALIAEMRRRIGFDAFAFLLTDPQTSVVTAPLADVPKPRGPGSVAAWGGSFARDGRGGAAGASGFLV